MAQIVFAIPTKAMSQSWLLEKYSQQDKIESKDDKLIEQLHSLESQFQRETANGTKKRGAWWFQCGATKVALGDYRATSF